MGAHLILTCPVLRGQVLLDTDLSTWHGLWILHSALHLRAPWGIGSSWVLPWCAPKTILFGIFSVAEHAAWMLPVLGPTDHVLPPPCSLSLLIFCRLCFLFGGGHKRFGEKSTPGSSLPSFEIRLLEIKGCKSYIFVFHPATSLPETKETVALLVEIMVGPSRQPSQKLGHFFCLQ